MAKEYFFNFPVIEYDINNDKSPISCVDITKFARIKKELLKGSVVYYPYTIKDGERPDTIAEDYYDDSKYFWLIFLANPAIKHPILDWPIHSYHFDNWVSDKYQNIAETQKQRKTFEVANTQNSFSVGHRIIGDTTNSYATVLSYDDSTEELEVLQLINNRDFTTSDNVYVDGTTSINANITTVTTDSFDTGLEYAHQTVKEYISGTGERVDAHTYANLTGAAGTGKTTKTIYEWEFEQNEAKRSINLISREYVDQIEREMSTIFQ